MEKRQVFAGNWKMHTAHAEALSLMKSILDGIKKTDGREYVVFPPSVYLRDVSELCKGTAFSVGAQNMYHEKLGAFTGEISPLMVKDCGCKFVLIGHSERRHIFHESDSDINLKVRSALEHGIEPLVCIGELLEEREGGYTDAVLERQITAVFNGLGDDQAEKILFAYEPVWAIGTGKVATPDIAGETHRSIRKIIKNIYGEELSLNIPVLYGGSVKPDNIAGLYEIDDIDGVLVGGASISAGSFLDIINVQG